MKFNILLENELERAAGIHGGFASLHEGIAVLREEYLELEQEIFLKHPDTKRVKEEAVQVAAMAKKLWMKAQEIEDLMESYEVKE